ncbi:MAG: hypothetical protein J07HX64_02103 [halophilic archaeon J07HX64]|nr:MAG: hypothetical protein J07HX64_02103 [halophilic archaeon J07HX64]
MTAITTGYRFDVRETPPRLSETSVQSHPVRQRGRSILYTCICIRFDYRDVQTVMSTRCAAVGWRS